MTPSLRSCFRCGVEFQSSQRGRVCPSCRSKPKASRDLSFREWQVVDRVAQGKASKVIAFELHLSEGTVKEYLHRIYRKLRVSNRVELAVWAMSAQPRGALAGILGPGRFGSVWL